MKRLLVFIGIFYSITVLSQHTVYSEAFFPNVPSSLVIVDNELYAAMLAGDASVQKINFSDPTTATLVSDFPDIGVWKMAYHQPTNSLYLYSLHNGSLNKIDLNATLPITFEEIVAIPFGSQGVVFRGDMLYIASRYEILSLDVTQGASSLSVYYSDPNTDLELRSPAIYGNDLYFGQKIVNDPNNSIAKIPLNSGNPTKTLVSDLTGIEGGIQSSLVVQNFLYLGFEATGPDLILKVDLDAIVPTAYETLINDIPGGPLGLEYRNGVFYASEGSNFSIVSFTDPNLSVDSFEVNKFDIYPIPAKDKLYLSASNQIDKFSIYSIDGKLLYEGDYTETGINVSGLDPGTYTLQIISGAQRQSKKFIKN